MPFPLISKWTDDFNPGRIIGEGAFGSVFSGIILFPDEVTGPSGQGRKVAVKKVNGEGIMASLLVANQGKETSNGFLEAIQREINVLSTFRHANIIRLVGYCLPPVQELRASGQRMKELCLVYELAPLGGLNGLLKDDHKASMMLWQYRLKIAIGVAKGLCCMHNNIPGRPAYHRDMKAANIAIMADYTAKIIDCGLSKYVPETSLEGLSMRSSASSRHGTLGYMCPLYCKRNMPYDSRCEIFSFGIVLIELITGCLQGSSDKDGGQIFLEDLMDDEDKPILADIRIQWPDLLVKDLLRLAGQCVAPYKGRTNSMITVMRDLVCVSQNFYTPTPMEEHLIERNNDLIAQLQGLELQKDVKAMQETEVTFKCEICFDEKVPASKGGFCSNVASPHFFCGVAHNDCFSDMVSSQALDQHSFERNGDSIVCVYCIASTPKVVSTFDLSLIVKQTNVEALGEFISAGKSVVQTKAEVALEKRQLEHTDELQKLREAHIEDKGARMKAATERHRQKIIEDILTLRCPHCNLVIIDFDGCFAVQHSEGDHGRYKQGCGLYFCGWCLEKCGTNDDCHNHVNACQHNLHPGSYYGTNDEFSRVHNQRRRALVLTYLQNVVDVQEREEIKRVLRRDLNDLGINI